MTKRLDLIFNGKGGVGKSFFATNFVQYLKDKNVPFIACDCDNENSTLKRFHGDDVQFLDLSHPRGLDAMILALKKTDLVVVDCRAASTDAFFNYFDEIDLPTTLKGLSAALTLITPINQEADSIDQLQRATEKLKSTCSYVVLRNTVHSEKFPLFENTVIRKRLLKELGAKEITLPKMQPWLVEELSHNNLTITPAVAGGETAFAGPPAIANVAAEVLRRTRNRDQCVAPCKIMSAPNQQPTPPNFDEDFLQAQEDWKQRHKIKDDDTILALMDLFRIHQNHWDEIRHRQMPSLVVFKADIAALSAAAKTLKAQAEKEVRSVDLATAICAALTAMLAGFLIGRFL